MAKPKSPQVAALTHLKKGFPNHNLPAFAVQAYVEDLQDLDLKALWLAVRYLRKTSRWFPSIAEIRERAKIFDEARRRELKIKGVRREFEDCHPPTPEDQSRVAEIIRNAMRKM